MSKDSRKKTSFTAFLASPIEAVLTPPEKCVRKR